MSVLAFVRHGQASAGSDDYDRLSPLGERQARLLGEHWARWGATFERAYVGPRRRHRQTAQIVADVYARCGLPWPETSELPALDEYPAFDLVRLSLPELVECDPVIQKSVPPDYAANGALVFDGLSRVFKRVTELWVRGELVVPGLENWLEFRERVERALPSMLDGEAARVVAFSSGGPMACLLGGALGLSDERTLDLIWRVRNGAYSEFLLDGDRLSLTSFNATPHLAAPDLLTNY